MKAIVLGLLIFLSGLPCLWSFSFGDLLDDVRQETKLTVGKSGTPSFYHDWRSGQQGFGLSTEIFAYRYLSADAGYFTMLDS